jgi:ribosomal-protein-serine acetyltransferase
MIENLISINGIHRFVIEVAINNNSSRKVAERLGMRLEGVIKDRELLYGKYVDAAMYAITAPEWNLRKT